VRLRIVCVLTVSTPCWINTLPRHRKAGRCGWMNKSARQISSFSSAPKRICSVWSVVNDRARGVASCGKRLRGLTHYQVDAVDGYEDLYRHFTNQPAMLGEPKELPTLAPQKLPGIAGRKYIFKAAGHFSFRILQMILSTTRVRSHEGCLLKATTFLRRVTVALNLFWRTFTFTLRTRQASGHAEMQSCWSWAWPMIQS